MHIEQVLERLRTFAARGAGFHLNEGAAVASIRAVEQQLQIELPEQVVRFWTAVNGLQVEEPPFQMFPLSQFSREARITVLRHLQSGSASRLRYTVRNPGQADGRSGMKAIGIPG